MQFICPCSYWLCELKSLSLQRITCKGVRHIVAIAAEITTS
nr:MAG TPA: hypothetical protein [Caudoviricetes sp.]